MARYIFGSRNNIHIIDLQKTVRELKRALTFIREVSSQGKSVLFIGTKKQAQEAVMIESQRSASPHVRERWLGGTLTNFETVRRSATRLQELIRMKQSGIFSALPKKEALHREKDIKRLQKSLDGIKDMEELPGAVFVVDPVQEHTAVLEARRMEIPVVAICDTNCDPDIIDYPIPGNDDAIRAVRLFCKLVSDSIEEGRQQAQKQTDVPPSENPAEKAEDASSKAEVKA